jgi:PhnB protein
MSNRPPKPATSPWMMACLTVRDADKAIEFYEKAFGFHTRFVMPGPDGKAAHAEVGWKDTAVMFGPERPDFPQRKSPATLGVQSPMSLYVYVEDVDAFHAHAVAHGAKSVTAPATMFWGDRMCTLADPDGYTWSFGTNVADFDPAKAAEAMAEAMAEAKAS